MNIELVYLLEDFDFDNTITPSMLPGSESQKAMHVYR